MRPSLRLVTYAAIAAFIACPVGFALAAVDCVSCHTTVTPMIVQEWNLSRHASRDITCSMCHGNDHTSAEDALKADIPTYQTCARCHPKKADQFAAGKHAKAWDSMAAMPTVHWQPMEMIGGMKGCGGCHKIGIKPATMVGDMQTTDRTYGMASCDACHTRHQFSVKEAQNPQACRTCHMGIDHPQWEMYSSSKHGVRHQLVQEGALPAESAAPTCQYCHMPSGDHEVGTAWGFLAVRLPMPEDKDWAADRATIMKALGVLDPGGKPTARLDAVAKLDIVRTTQESWEGKREAMIQRCGNCHSTTFARSELEKGDALIRESDKLLAEAIRTVAGLYQDMVIYKPEYYGYPYPDLLAFHDAPTVVEQKLFKMFLEHRMRTFQGAFHANPDYAFWYGWSEMRQDLTEIKALTEDMVIEARRAARDR